MLFREKIGLLGVEYFYVCVLFISTVGEWEQSRKHGCIVEEKMECYSSVKNLLQVICYDEMFPLFLSHYGGILIFCYGICSIKLVSTIQYKAFYFTIQDIF